MIIYLHSVFTTTIVLLTFSLPVGSMELQTGLNGTWHNPEQHGQGLVVQVAPANDLLFAAWFTYTADTGEQMWLTAHGDLSAHPVSLTINNTTGGGFDAAEPTPNTTVWGSAQLEFHDCLNATLSFNGDSTGQINLTRITPPLDCVEDQP
jgi:hypothetical protein